MTEVLSAEQPAGRGEMSPAGSLVISVDVEDWPQSTWDHSLAITTRAERNAARVLDILAKYGRTATLFILGKFAERFPAMVKRMAAEGHEVASHGYGHVEIFRQRPGDFCEDVRRAKHLLEDLTGRPVLGYRAPDFSIVAQTLWALDILAEVGYRYDSSIYPIRNSRYGIPQWPNRPVRVRLATGLSIVELPIATLTWRNRRLPVAGGGYHRLLPWLLIRRAIAQNLRQDIPFVLYCHPYEFDPKEFAELDLSIPVKTRLHQGLGRGGFQAKFELMLTTFASVPAYHLALNRQWPDYDPDTEIGVLL